MIAALQTLRAQKIRDLVGAPRQHRKRQFGFLVTAGIDNPERRTIPALRIARQFRIEPVQRPVERNSVRPAEIGNGLVVIAPVLQEKGAGFLKGCHVLCPIGQSSYENVIARSRATKQSSGAARTGLLRGASHRACIRATRWLAMTNESFAGQFSDVLDNPGKIDCAVAGSVER